MKYFFKRDTLMATIAVFIVMWLLSIIPANTHLFDPLKQALFDVSFNDLSFSTVKSKGEDIMEDKIVVVNIDTAGRASITSVINKLAESEAAAIGLDVLFLEEKDKAVDMLLEKAIRKCNKIILSETLLWQDDTALQQNIFSNIGKPAGYVNFIGEHKGVIRYFSPFEETTNKQLPSFAKAVVKEGDPVAARLLEKRGNEVEMINYKRSAEQFVTVQYNDLIAGNVNMNMFKDKIVLVGYVNNSPYNIEDKHFTPLNEKFTGKSIPDMNGVIIHANIISMILHDNYINTTPKWINWFFTFVATWFFMAFIIRYYLEKHIWFHLVAKLVQLLLAVLLIYISIFFLKYTRMYISFGALLFAVMLSVDIVYFYEGLANWLNKKYKFKTILQKKHS